MKHLNLLLVDDDEDDRLFFQEAFSEVAQDSNLLLMKDGQELMSYLSDSQTVLPDIIFLDLNMPIVDGNHCLEQIRRNPLFEDIFIVINTTTASQKEINLVYESGANLFLMKPNSFGDLKKSIQAIVNLDHKNIMNTRRKDQFVFNPGSLGNLLF